MPGFLKSSFDDSHYVRMRYNGRPIALPACAPVGLHLEGRPDVCTLEGFRKAVEKVEMTGKEWSLGCAYVEPQEAEKP